MTPCNLVLIYQRDVDTAVPFIRLYGVMYQENWHLDCGVLFRNMGSRLFTVGGEGGVTFAQRVERGDCCTYSNS